MKLLDCSARRVCAPANLVALPCQWVESTTACASPHPPSQRGQMELVFIVSDGKAQLRLVKTGKRLGSDD